jgi:hypothetical protein
MAFPSPWRKAVRYENGHCRLIVFANENVDIYDVDARNALAPDNSADLVGVRPQIEHRAQRVRMPIIANVEDDKIPLNGTHRATRLGFDNLKSDSSIRLGETVKKRSCRSSFPANGLATSAHALDVFHDGAPFDQRKNYRAKRIRDAFSMPAIFKKAAIEFVISGLRWQRYPLFRRHVC